MDIPRCPCYRLTVTTDLWSVTRQMWSTLFICISFQRGHHDQIAKLVEVKCFFLQKTPEMSEKIYENCFFIILSPTWMFLFSNRDVSFFQQGCLELVWGGCRGRPLVPASVHKVVLDSLLISLSWAT